MSSDFEAYEQDFGTLTAEITNKIGRIPKLAGEEKTQLVLNVDKQLEEVRELLEQMDLEVREIPIQSRGMYNSRLKSYKQEMEKLEKDFKRSRIAYSDEVRNELLGEDGSSSESQRAHLLDNTERLERSSRRLEAGYQIAVETEQVGQEILANLHSDREKIQMSRDRLRETDANLGKSSRILTGMLRSRRKKVTHIWDGVRQDLAPVHTAKSTKSWLNDHGVGVLDWPANSPDQNSIENLWGIVKRKMRNKRPTNADELKATFKETWASIPPQQCHKLITSMPRQIEAVIKAKGAPTKY
ncbi:vesicle transport through interaction with t-SNAREs homolog 1A-like isoform X1 [Myxocyprinus asiaticus]|uniref:vesicle transport through interaction with t-SNAREs homolog 1A-like isoform X1 n=1 Tax=Myxocyprinus asiaticus TaxID=70543 RepID=UPI0022222003|nr:vesicle transport through interaction with t-SNAREs homolog 1A-like isoform X1 [Myxocyprinus asiaticus]